jgi:futalosine hydrolase
LDLLIKKENNMKVLVVAATPFEILPLEAFLRQHFVAHGPASFQFGPLNVTVLITGVGLTATAFALGQTFAVNRFDLAINAGICGAINPGLAIGDVVQIVRESFGDLGAEQSDGSFTDIFELGLTEKDQTPFQAGALHNEAGSGYEFLPKVTGISVNKVHGCSASIEKLHSYSDADVESMEGAAFFYACLMCQIPFLEIRAISNHVEPRNRDNWNIPLAIDALSRVMIEMMQSLSGK